MFISNVHIENFRNFTTIDVPLKQFSIVIGNNDMGKSNLIDAINILLYNSKSNYYAKSLSKYDFNTVSVIKFKEYLQEVFAECNSNGSNLEFDKYLEKLYMDAPKITIRLRFENANTEYEKALLRDWLNGDDNQQYFEIEYQYFLENKKRLKETLSKMVEDGLFDEHYNNFDLFLDCYNYSLKSTNNNKDINYTKIKNFMSNIISAERDAFSNDDNVYSSKIISKIIDSGLSLKDKIVLKEKYKDFFSEVKTLETFKDIYDEIIEQNSEIKNFIDEIILVPNAKKYKDILENITISYGNDMLFQRGLGTRNLILILTLYSYFISDKNQKFNLVCIEEPESHLDINNFKLTIEFIQKAKDKNGLAQLILTTHNNHIINKLDMNSVTLLVDDCSAINFTDIDQKFVYYLSKRENFDTFNLIFAKRLILVEGATEEIYLNCLLQHQNINNLTILSVGQKGFKTFIEIWNRLHPCKDKLGIIRDYDSQDKAKSEHEEYISDFVHVSTASGKEFEDDFVMQTNNLDLLNDIFSGSYDNDEMIEFMKNDKLNSIISVCQAIDDGKKFEIPDYINTLLEWIKK